MPNLNETFQRIRAKTVSLIAPLSAEDCCVQSMPDASPAKWHLAHTTWFFETFVLEVHGKDFVAFDPAFKVLFNSYYNQVGDKHPRHQRGLLTRPSLAEVLAYRAHVDARMTALLGEGELAADVSELVTLGLNHEQQHQELLLMDIQHLLSCNPLLPAYDLARTKIGPVGEPTWVDVPKGLVDIGFTGTGFAFDNEMPRHTVYVQPSQLSSCLVSNAQYLAFVQAGGYKAPGHWLAEGWDWLRQQSREHPLYWREQGSAWMQFTLAGLVELDLAAPVMQVSYFEADAFARWAGARLPTEAEWEAAACADAQRAQPQLTHLFGTAWQWTQSSYAPYPGFKNTPGAVGEYNGKFMVNQYVLRGSSVATPEGHARLTYRNFFPAHACWQLSGIRLAR